MKTSSKTASLTVTAITALAMVAAVSCEDIIDYKGPETEPKAVIYALLQPDNFISVSVSESHSVFQVPWKPRQITDAVVRVYRDGELLETLPYSVAETEDENAPVSPYSLYASKTNFPEYGHTYRIEVLIPGYPAAAGETSLPAPVPVAIADTSYSNNEYGYRELNMNLRFRDPAGEENFYRFTAPSSNGFYTGDPNLPYDPEQVVYVRVQDLNYGALSDPIIEPVHDDDFFDMYLENDYYIFNDELISGKEYNMNLTYGDIDPDVEYYEFLHAFFRISSLTKDLYLYLQSYSAYRQTNDDPLSEPVQVYSNVSNGLGIVGAMSFSQDSIIIGEYPVEGVRYEIHLY